MKVKEWEGEKRGKIELGDEENAGDGLTEIRR